jgi:hypothetical protein
MSGKENTIVGRPVLLADDDLTSEAQTATGGALISGLEVDLQSTTDRRYRRIRVQVPYRVVNSTTGDEVVDLTATPQHRETTGGAGSTWANFGTAPAAENIAATGTTDAVWEFEQDLTTAARRYRIQFTAEFQTNTGGISTATGVTFIYSGMASLTDANRFPASG